MVGGGITGAGVALDAASRGYSVALLERNDFASGTSSRSSKLVHGGLRYLQNFDLGLVREALLERRLMVQLAPHLVRPLPLVVPAFDGARPDRLVGMGLNLYDVMSVERGGRRSRRSRRARGRERGSGRRRRRRGGGGVLEPRAPPRDQRRGSARAAARAGAARAHQRLPLLRLPDRRRAPGPDGARRGRALRGRVREPRRGAGPARARGALARRRGARRRERLALSGARRQRRQRHRRVGRPAAPAGAPRGGRAAAHPPQPRHPHPAAGLGAAAEGRGDRARRRGTLDLRPAVARARADRHHRQRLRGPARARRPLDVRRRVPARGRQRLLRHRLRARRSVRRVRRACAR